MPRVTKRVVDEATPRSSAFFLWCSDLKGFGCRIHPTGKKTYYVDYRNDAGARKRMKIGDHGKVTCDEARKIALSTLGGVIKGDDPLTERVTRRSSITVRDLCVKYMEEAERGAPFGKKSRPKKISTIIQDQARIDRHIAPLLGNKLVIEVTRADVARFIRDVSVGKTATDQRSGKKRGRARVTGGAGTAARAAGFLGALLQFAVNEGIIEHNPARGVKRKPDEKRTRRLTPEEYRAIGGALAHFEIDPEAWRGVAGVRLLALTGCRRGEIVNLKWSEVDEAGRAFRLEDSKEGASVRPIGREALDVLASLPRGGTYVLPSSTAGGSKPYGALDGFIERIVKRAGLQGVTAHVLRHSFASMAGDLGMAESTIAALLGHAGGTVTSRYVHHLDAVLIAAADKVAGAIHKAMTGDAADVLAFSTPAQDCGRTKNLTTS